MERCVAEIDLKQLEENIIEIKRKIGDTRIISVVKADAYGHGSVAIASKLEMLGIDMLAVATIDEAIELRIKNISADILVLNKTYKEDIYKLEKYNLIQSVGDSIYFQELGESQLELRIHFKIDTGMSRNGFQVSGKNFETSTNEIVKNSKKYSRIKIEGIYTHFHSAADEKITKEQFGLFIKTINLLEKWGLKFNIKHCSNSIASVLYPEMRLDAVRIGMVQYGIDETDLLNVHPILKLKARISEVKKIDSNQSVGYDRTFTANKPTDIAIVSAGYADGIHRSLSNRGYVTIEGKKCKIIGRVCMDVITVDITNLKRMKDIHGKEVVILDSKESYNDFAKYGNTITYEVLTSISRRVKRKYLNTPLK